MMELCGISFILSIIIIIIIIIATTCLLCSPPNLNFLVTFFIFVYM